jgi:hypothetical protein
VNQCTCVRTPFLSSSLPLIHSHTHSHTAQAVPGARASLCSWTARSTALVLQNTVHEKWLHVFCATELGCALHVVFQQVRGVVKAGAMPHLPAVMRMLLGLSIVYAVAHVEGGAACVSLALLLGVLRVKSLATDVCTMLYMLLGMAFPTLNVWLNNAVMGFVSLQLVARTYLFLAQGSTPLSVCFAVALVANIRELSSALKASLFKRNDTW